MAKKKRVRKPRAYQPIWERIKVHKVCKVKIQRKLVAKLKKAVIKEKYMDDDYRERFNGELKIEIIENQGPLEVTVVFRLDEVSKFI